MWKKEYQRVSFMYKGSYTGCIHKMHYFQEKVFYVSTHNSKDRIGLFCFLFFFFVCMCRVDTGYIDKRVFKSIIRMTKDCPEDMCRVYTGHRDKRVFCHSNDTLDTLLCVYPIIRMILFCVCTLSKLSCACHQKKTYTKELF